MTMRAVGNLTAEQINDFYIETHDGKSPLMAAVQRIGLPGYSFASVAGESIDGANYIVKGVINRGDVAFMFGDSATLKSFVATDACYHAAAGIDWHGFKVKQTAVLIVIGEGQGGYKKRLKAVIKKYGAHDVPIWIVPEPVALDRDTDLLQTWIAKAEKDLGQSIGLVLMDTFSLMLGDGDESSNADVSIALNGLRKAVSGRAVLLVHHTGHGDKSRERGAYQIRGNADVRILIERDNHGNGKVITVTNLKSKHDRLFDPIYLGYEVIEVGTDEDGEPITSLVMVPTDQIPTGGPKDTGVCKALYFIQKSISHCESTQKEVVRAAFAGLYPSDNKETIRGQFRRGWQEYMNRVTVDDEQDLTG